jgi:hypothetical protein
MVRRGNVRTKRSTRVHREAYRRKCLPLLWGRMYGFAIWSSGVRFGHSVSTWAFHAIRISRANVTRPQWLPKEFREMDQQNIVLLICYRLISHAARNAPARRVARGIATKHWAKYLSFQSSLYKMGWGAVKNDTTADAARSVLQCGEMYRHYSSTVGCRLRASVASYC